MKKALTVVFLTLALASTASAQLVRDMTPDRIREAINLGMSAKVLSPYKLQEKARFNWPPLLGFYATPFLRVALAANAAKRKYQQFTEKDVTPDMVAPEIYVYAPSHSLAGTGIANVVTIVLLPAKSKDRSRAIQPTQTAQATEAYKNLFGFSGEGQALLAVFPLDVWTEGNEVHVVFDSEIPSSQGYGALGGCTDCKSRIYLEKVR